MKRIVTTVANVTTNGKYGRLTVNNEKLAPFVGKQVKVFVEVLK